MNLILIGYRGTGKSTVGRLLGKRLGWNVISTDAEIVAREGRSIPEIVNEKGWEYFRQIEAGVCADVGRRDRTVIDTGGGAILRDENVRALKHNGKTVWLTAQVATIVGRIGKDNQRPSLTGAKSFTEEVEEVLSQRTPKYQAAADATVATDGVSAERLVEQILAAWPGELSVKAASVSS